MVVIKVITFGAKYQQKPVYHKSETASPPRQLGWLTIIKYHIFPHNGSPEGKKECGSEPFNKEGNSKVVCYPVVAEKMHICHRQSSISKQQGTRETTLNCFWNLNEINLSSVGLQFNYNQQKTTNLLKVQKLVTKFLATFYANHKHCKLTVWE